MDFWSFAFLAVTDPAQIFPRVEPRFMAVIPLEFESVFADRSNFDRPWRLFVHNEQTLRFRLRFAGGTAVLFAFLMTGGARAGVAQPAEAPGALMAIAPVNLDASAFGFLHPDLLWSDGLG